MLFPNDNYKTIGLITPSSPLFPGRLEKSIEYFEDTGFSVKVGEHNSESDRFLAGTDKQRASDIMSFYKDDSIDLLIVTGGGAGSIRTLPLLDYDVIRSHHKPIIGFSDTTALQCGIYSQTKLINYTGFTCRDIAEFETLNPVITASLNNCIQQRNYVVTGGETLRQGAAVGHLIGGNLSCLANLIGTPFQPDFSGCILLLEDVLTEPYVLDGIFSQFYLSGIFEQISGLVFGTFIECDAKYYPDRDGNADDVIADWSRRINVPTITKFPYGHFDDRNVLPIGAEVALDAETCELKIKFC